MEKYRFNGDQQAFMEQMAIPFAVFQFIDNRIVPVALSDGFCGLLGIGDRDSAYTAVERDTYKHEVLQPEEQLCRGRQAAAGLRRGPGPHVWQ